MTLALWRPPGAIVTNNLESYDKHYLARLRAGGGARQLSCHSTDLVKKLGLVAGRMEHFRYRLREHWRSSLKATFRGMPDV